MKEMPEVGAIGVRRGQMRDHALSAPMRMSAMTVGVLAKWIQ